MTSVNIPVVVETSGAIQRLRNVSGRVTDLNTRARGLGGSFLRGAILGGLLGSSLGGIATQLISTSNAGRAVTSSIQRLIQSLLQPIEGPLVRFLSAFDANPFLQGATLIIGGLLALGAAFLGIAAFVTAVVRSVGGFIGFLRGVGGALVRLITSIPGVGGILRGLGGAFRFAGLGILRFLGPLLIGGFLIAAFGLAIFSIIADLFGFDEAAERSRELLDKLIDAFVPEALQDFITGIDDITDGLFGIEREAGRGITGIDLFSGSIANAVTESALFGLAAAGLSGLWERATNVIHIGWLLLQLGVFNVLNAIVKANNNVADFFIRTWDASVERVEGFFYRLRTIALDVVNFIIRAINRIPSIDISFETVSVGPVSFSVPRVRLGGSLFNIAEIQDPGRPNAADRFSDTGNDGDTYNVTVNAPNVFDTTALEEQLIRLLNQNAQFRNEVFE